MITVFLRKYSDASSTEVGTLLMVLPLLAVFTKPFFCALADRHRRYKLYFILALLFTLLGFGAYTFIPFFPDFVRDHGRASWWLLVVFTVIGYIAYGVVWSLGDAYAANVSHRTGESFGLIRLWGTVGWGVSGAVVGAVSPYLQLPEMVLGFLIFVATHIIEILLLIWWPNDQDFVMGDVENSNQKQLSIDQKPKEQPQKQLRENILVAENCQLSIVRTESNQLQICAKLDQQQVDKHKLDKTIEELLSRTEQAKLDEERERIASLQTTILKLVARRHKSLIKYLVLFVLLGTVYNIHWSYFFLHLDRLASEGKGGDFSTLVGLCLVAQAVGETFCFAIAPWVVSKLGRDGSISLNALAYAVRYFGNGLGIPLVSPFVAVLTESLQGINYGIFYYLITDTALHYALLVDDVIPELLELGLIDKSSNLDQVRTSLRATMQGVFSGAFDGLGFGLGSIVAGLVLESHSYEELWCFAGAAALVIFVLHAVYELIQAKLRRSNCRKSSAQQVMRIDKCTDRSFSSHNFK